MHLHFVWFIFIFPPLKLPELSCDLAVLLGTNRSVLQLSSMSGVNLPLSFLVRVFDCWHL